jgi:ATP-dependent helicase HrpB
MDPLPIDPLLPDIVAAVTTFGACVVEAPPGAGKTTRVPPALWRARPDTPDELWVLEPRRLPARLAAQRVASELGQAVGGTVGYSVRFEECASARTRIRFVTEGILLRRLLGDPALAGIWAVVLDEFHERHLASDLVLALLARLRRTRRPDLGLCVMSATLDAQPIAEFLGDCPRVRSEGRRFEVALEHLGLPDDRPLAVQVVSTVRRVLEQDPDGDVLVFLPGAADIRRCQEALLGGPGRSGGGDTAGAGAGAGGGAGAGARARADARTAGPARSWSSELDVLPLHGDLSLEAQARVVAPSARRKVILATNVAETSVTIDGVTIVIDTGLAKLAGHSPWTGLSTLSLGKISQASAIQRAGRAGRTRPGRAVRLYSAHDFQSRRPFDLPEIARLDLAELVLTTRALGIADVAALDFLTEPPSVSVTAAEQLLRRLGALGPTGALTEIGESLVRFPLHPRLARLIVEGERRDVGPDAALLAALVSERDIRERGGFSGETGSRSGAGPRGAGGRAQGGIDLLALLELFERARGARSIREGARAAGLDGEATARVDQTRRHLVAMLARASGASGDRGGNRPPPARVLDRAAADRALAWAVLTAFPDRVARVRQTGGQVVLLSAGGTAELGYVPDSAFLVAVDAEESSGNRGGGGGGPARATGATVRLGCGIEPDWLADLPGTELEATDSLELDPATERVVRRSRLTYGALTVTESVRIAEPSPEAARILADAALARGPEAVAEPGTLETLRARLAWLATLTPPPAAAATTPTAIGAAPSAIPSLDGAQLRAALVEACAGLRGFAELRGLGADTVGSDGAGGGDRGRGPARGFTARLEAGLPPDVRAALARETPTHLVLPGGRRVPISYPEGQPPFVESRLQDFFGMSVGPRIARGRVPLTLHLLGPNGRAVQVTSDLASFWAHHYPAIRRELQRRYPRHSWPEDGAKAAPPAPRAPRSHGRRD